MCLSVLTKPQLEPGTAGSVASKSFCTARVSISLLSLTSYSQTDAGRARFAVVPVVE